MIAVFLIIAAFGLFVWLGRRARQGRADWRLGGALFVVLAAGGATVAFAKGEPLFGVGLGVAAVLFLIDIRGRKPIKPATAPPPQQPAGRGGMTDAQAREVLGVLRTASPTEIRDAYRRLMRAVHPDQGGSPALAAQINAARDQLLGKD